MIPLMNITRQYESIQDELDSKALEILHAGRYIMGEEVWNFEKEFARYIGVNYAAGVGNGTDALVIALRALGVGRGDEVITTAMSFFATAEAVAMVGATPVFVDCTDDTYTMDAAQIEARITSRTKAILPVHLYGQCADMDAISAIARKHGLYVVEDAAQAAGASYKGKKAGSLGDAACVSFFPTKNLGCAGDGGMILTDHKDIYKKCCAYRMHGSGENGYYTYCTDRGGQCTETPDYQGNLPKYFNYVTGHNSRLDALQAGLLRVKLPYLDTWNQKRQRHAEGYGMGIINKGVKKPVCAPGNGHIYYTYILCVENRECFRKYMEQKGIMTGIYFPVPLHLQKAFEGLGYRKGDMPNAEYLAEHGVAVPMFAELEAGEREKVIAAVNGFG